MQPNATTSTGATSPTSWFPPVILLFALLPLGASSLPALNVVLLLVSAAFVAHVALLAAREGTPAAVEKVLDGTHWLPLVALPAYVAAQLVGRLLLGGGAAPVFAISQSTVSLIALALFYVLVRGAAAEPRGFRIVLGGLALIGGLEALYGLLNLLAGNERLLIWKRWIFLDSATGTLSSRNHFAYLMEMLLPASIAYAIVFGRALGRRRDDDTAERTARTAVVATLAVICALGLLFSHSRMGILSFALAYAAVAVLDRALRPAEGEEASARKGWSAVAAGFAVVVAALAAAIGLDSVLERFLRIENDFVAGRWPIWQAALEMFRDGPLFGQGWGTFEALLPAYRSEPNGFYYTHAHNDWFEVLAEGGIVGAALALWLVFLFARRLVTTLEKPLHPTQRSVVFWTAVALTSTLLHSFADYGLRTAGVAFTFVAIAALFSRATEQPELMISRPRHRRRRSRTSERPS